jgi:hypothetical protein
MRRAAVCSADEARERAQFGSRLREALVIDYRALSTELIRDEHVAEHLIVIASTFPVLRYACDYRGRRDRNGGEEGGCATFGRLRYSEIFLARRAK